MVKAGLVLEGGGMRGLYTAGVLEYFMEQNLYFPYNIGVSAGACMAASYLSRQKGRNKKVNLGYIEDKRYISFSNFIKNREIFGMDFIFDEIPNRLVPFDMDTFRKSYYFGLQVLFPLSHQVSNIRGVICWTVGLSIRFRLKKHNKMVLKKTSSS